MNIKTDDRILNWYLFGSRLYGTHNDKSDYDYIVVVSDDKLNEVKTDYTDISTHVYSESEFQRKIQNMDITALEAIFSSDDFKSENKKFNFIYNENNLRTSISTITSNSWVKGKKKLTIAGDYDLDIALKSIFHSIRIMDYGIQIAKYKTINTWDSYNYILKDLYKLSESYNYDELWNMIDTKYRSEFLKLRNEFRSLVNKRNENMDLDFLRKKLKKFNVSENIITEIYTYFK